MTDSPDSALDANKPVEVKPEELRKVPGFGIADDNTLNDDIIEDEDDIDDDDDDDDDDDGYETDNTSSSSSEADGCLAFGFAVLLMCLGIAAIVVAFRYHF